MFLLFSEGKRIGICESLRYIYLKPSSGCFVEARTPEQQQGVAFKGIPYNLPGHTEIFRDVVNEDGTVSRETAPEIHYEPVDGGEMLLDTFEDAEAGLEAVTELYESLLDKGVL